MSKSIEERIKESFKYGANFSYLENLYNKYLTNPDTVESKWKQYFDSIQNGTGEINHQHILQEFKNKKFYSNDSTHSVKDSTSNKSSDVQNLVNAYRRRGHQIATIDPLDLRVKKEIPELGLSFHNLTPNDLTEKFALSNFLNSKEMQLKDILNQSKVLIPQILDTSLCT